MNKLNTQRKSSDALDRLIREIDKIKAPATKTREEDTRFWKIERDKSGNGSAVIRFLPAAEVDGEDALPFIRYFDHGFKGPTGKWYIEKSLTSLNQKDPVSEYNSELWNATSDDSSPMRKQAREQKRRLHYISNIYVVSDPKHPENEGKVFLFKYGKKIFDKITLAMRPEFEDEQAVNPFDLLSGANFKLRIRTVEGYPNYDQSLFEAPGPLTEDNKELASIVKKQYSLSEFIDPKGFKSYDELKKRLYEVMGDGPVSGKSPTVTNNSAPKKPAVKETAYESDDDDDDLKAFKALAED